MAIVASLPIFITARQQAINVDLFTFFQTRNSVRHTERHTRVGSSHKTL